MTDPNPNSFDLWEEQLSAPPPTAPLNHVERFEVQRILQMIGRGESINTYVASLIMRYNIDRWHAIVLEVQRQAGEV